MSGDLSAVGAFVTGKCINNLPISRINITDKFFSACHYAVEPGNLVHGEEFSLQHAMSAIEIMDPKMDMGMRGSRCIASVSELLTKGCLPLGPFSELDLLLGIMDELLAATVNWLTGDSLPQSIFICMYMHCTQLLRDPYLAVFCELLRRVIRNLQQLICSVKVFDEEDHYFALHGMPLLKPSSEFDAHLSDLPANTLEFYNLSDTALINKSKQMAETLLESDWKLGGANVQACISTRLKFIHTFLEMVLALSDATRKKTEQIYDGYSASVSPPNYSEPSIRVNKAAHSYDIDVQSHINEVNRLDVGAESFKRNPDRCPDQSNSGTSLSGWDRLDLLCTEVQQLLSRLMQLCKEMVSTVTVGRPPGQGRLSPKNSDYGLPGFEPFLNQNVLPSFIPRFVVIQDRLVAFNYWSQLVSRLNRLIASFKMFSILARDINSSNASSTTISGSVCYLLWCLFQSNGQKTNPKVVGWESGHVFDVSINTSTEDLSFSSCVVARTVTFLLFTSQIKNIDESDLLRDNHTYMTLCSWLVLEPCQYHPLLKDVIRQQQGLRTYFEQVSDNLTQIAAIYCLNRSRQRSALYHYLQMFTNMLSESQPIEWILSVELSKLLGFSSADQQLALGTDNQSGNSPTPVRLCHSTFLCYLYYQLVWDFIICGFQLELYAPHEWIFTYTFLIQLLQSLSDLLQQMVTTFKVNNNLPYVHNVGLGAVKNTNSPACQSNNCQSLPAEAKMCPLDGTPASTQPVHGGSRSKFKHKGAKKKRNSATNGDRDETASHDITSPSVPSHGLSLFAIPGSDMELLSLTCHRFMTAATMYCLRALQIDSGGDPVLDGCASESSGYLNPLEVYKQRLGIFITSPDSPLYETHGVANAFESCKQYLTTGLFSFSSTPADTSELYMLASKNFENARLRAQQVSSLRQEKRKQGADDLHYQFVGAHHLGSPDDPSDLEKLARHNSVACRILAGYPDRRPRNLRWYSWSTLSASSVRLEFDAVSSRMYPLLRFVSQSGETTS